MKMTMLHLVMNPTTMTVMRTMQELIEMIYPISFVGGIAQKDDDHAVVILMMQMTMPVGYGSHVMCSKCATTRTLYLLLLLDE